MHGTSPYFPRVKVYTQADGKVCIHPKSVNAEETEFNYTWLIYHLKMRTSSVSRRGWGGEGGGDVPGRPPSHAFVYFGFHVRVER